MRILFVCTGNSCRSAIAKGYLEKRLKELDREDVDVYSAGIAALPCMPATKEAKQVVKEAGGNISDHRARRLLDLDVRQADLIFVMEDLQRQYILDKYPSAKKKTYLLKNFKKLKNFDFLGDSNIPDPITKDINFYRNILEVIKESIERVLKEI